MADPRRNALWACAVDLSFQTASQLRAFDLRTGELRASYPMPAGGVCGDITLAGRDRHVRRADRPAHRPWRVGAGTITMWSADPKLAGGGPLKINGIAFDGHSHRRGRLQVHGRVLDPRLRRTRGHGPGARKEHAGFGRSARSAA